MFFQTVDDATSIWIKGREFTVARMLGDYYKDKAPQYEGGSLAIFRLAPQDYHRYHSVRRASLHLPSLADTVLASPSTASWATTTTSRDSTIPVRLPLRCARARVDFSCTHPRAQSIRWVRPHADSLWCL